jgi:hypothetical protein
VYNSALIAVLKLIGFGDLLISWFSSYFFNGTQYVKTNGVYSKLVNIKSGVLLGRNWSPILFSLFVNSVKSILKH